MPAPCAPAPTQRPVRAPVPPRQIDLDQSRAELKAAVDAGGGKGLNEFLDGLGLGMVAAQLKDLSLGELLDTPPPGVDEAIAIAKVGGLVDGGWVVGLGLEAGGWGLGSPAVAAATRRPFTHTPSSKRTPTHVHTPWRLGPRPRWSSF